jgi:hypothetical protein
MPRLRAGDRDVAPGDGRRRQQRARLDAVGDDPVPRAAQLGNPLDLDALGAGPLDAGAHGNEQAREIRHLGLAGRVLDHGGALGQRRRHHEVLGAGDGDEVGGDARALEPARPRLDVAVLDGDLGAEPGQPLEVLIDGPHADGAAAGQRHPRHPARATSGPSTSTEARMVETSSYGASGLVTRRTQIRVLPSASSAVSPPSFSSSDRMVRTSASAGTFSRITGSAVSSAAASAGSAAFLAALVATSPRRGRPPSITSLTGIRPPRRGQAPRNIARDPTQVLARGDIDEALGLHQPGHGRRLVLADLEHQPAAGPQSRGRGREKAPDHRQAVGPAVQRLAGLEVKDLARQRRKNPAAEIGRVGDDHGESARLGGQRRQEIAGEETDAIGKAQRPDIAFRHRERGRRQLRREHSRVGRSVASAQAMAPEPVPMSATELGDLSAASRRTCSFRAHSTSPSVSGRGMRTSGVTRRRRPRKSS